METVLASIFLPVSMDAVTAKYSCDKIIDLYWENIKLVLYFISFSI